MFTKDVGLNQLMNHKGVCRTAPATPGLLTKLLPKNTLLFGAFFSFLSTGYSQCKKKSLASFALKLKQTDNVNKHIFFIFNI